MTLFVGKHKIHVPENIPYFFYRTMLWDTAFYSKSLYSSNLEIELQNSENWGTNSYHSDRLTYIGNSKIINDICNTINKEKNNLLSRAYKTHEHVFKSKWHLDLEYYKENTEMITCVFKDSPNFEMQPHIDYDDIILENIINLTDNPTGTKFYSIGNTDPHYTASTKKGQGVMFLNTAGALHSIQNNSRDRFILLSMIKLKNK
jgi:hypothetical protein